MKVYIAATFERKEEVKEIQQRFIKQGHVISADWTTHKTIAHEAKQEELAKEYAIEDVDGVSSTDLFILLVGERKSTGAHIELGVALGANVPNVYVVGETDDSSLFYYHPKVKRIKTIDEILSKFGNPA